MKKEIIFVHYGDCSTNLYFDRSIGLIEPFSPKDIPAMVSSVIIEIKGPTQLIVACPIGPTFGLWMVLKDVPFEVDFVELSNDQIL